MPKIKFALPMEAIEHFSMSLYVREVPAIMGTKENMGTLIGGEAYLVAKCGEPKMG